jgi:hypothetical protein
MTRISANYTAQIACLDAETNTYKMYAEKCYEKLATLKSEKINIKMGVKEVGLECELH